MRSLRFAFLPVILAIAACDALLGPTDRQGTFELTVTGAVEERYEGIARLESGSITDAHPYAIHFSTSPSERIRGVFLYLPGRPRARTYTVVPWRGEDLGRGEALAVYNKTDFRGFLSTAGELVITSADPLRGTLRFTATEGAGSDVQVQGSFDFR